MKLHEYYCSCKYMKCFPTIFPRDIDTKVYPYFYCLSFCLYVINVLNWAPNGKKVGPCSSFLDVRIIISVVNLIIILDCFYFILSTKGKIIETLYYFLSINTQRLSSSLQRRKHGFVTVLSAHLGFLFLQREAPSHLQL